jgi:NADH dehydrogenase (ubiquinone) Fe-S protein 1
LADGSHPFFKTLASAKRPAVIVGAQCLQRADGATILANVQKLSQNVRIQSKCGSDWRVLNILQRVASQVCFTYFIRIEMIYVRRFRIVNSGNRLM